MRNEKIRLENMEDGVYLVGEYRGYERFQNERGGNVRVDVLVGRNVHSVYMDSASGDDMKEHDIGEGLVMSARPYVNKRNYLTWAGGKIRTWMEDEEDEGMTA